MSHIGVDIIDFLLLTIYPVAGLLVIELGCRIAKTPSWPKLLAQGFISLAFAIGYLTLIVAHWMTSIVLFALAIALFYQARVAKLKPGKSIY